MLCIAGSPRRGGNSDTLLDALSEGVESAGGIADRLVAADPDIAPCRGCGSCSHTGRCVIDDRMHEVRAAIDAADAIAVATPVYFASVPSQLKALYDRCQPYWARRYVLGEPGRNPKRPGALIVVGSGGDPFGTQCAVTPTRSVFGVLGVSLDEVLEVVGPDAKGDVASDPGALARARSMGEWIVRESTRRGVTG